MVEGSGGGYCKSAAAAIARAIARGESEGTTGWNTPPKLLLESLSAVSRPSRYNWLRYRWGAWPAPHRSSVVPRGEMGGLAPSSSLQRPGGEPGEGRASGVRGPRPHQPGGHAAGWLEAMQQLAISSQADEMQTCSTYT